jgi:hypothetical protein
VLFALGLNDILHGSDQHCQDDWPIHVKNLQTEASRVFPSAKLCFILPFRGLPKASRDKCNDMQGKIKSLLPKFKRYLPPFMKGKVRDDGVHINEEGKELYKKFLQKHFVPITPQARSDTVPATVDRVGLPNGESFRVTQPGFPVLQHHPQDLYSQHRPHVPAASQHHPPAPVPYYQPQYPLDHQRSQVLREISNMATYMLGVQSYNPQQPHVNMNYMPTNPT